MQDLLILHAVPITALVAGVLLFLAAPRLVAFGAGDQERTLPTLILRTVIAAFIILQLADLVVHQTLAAYYDRLLLRMSLTMLSIIVGVIFFNLATHVLDMKFGSTRSLDGKKVWVPSYHSRMASMILFSVLLILLGYALIEIWGMESLLEKSGFIGVIAAFLVLTSSIWLPDIFHGLVLLGSSMADEGDTIAIPDQNRLYIINRLTPFYALLLDVDNNHRVLMRNSELIRERVENLTRRASVDGLRRQIEFKLGYPKPGEDHGRDGRLFGRVDQMVAAAFERAAGEESVRINPNIPFDWSLVEAGDNALRFVVYYHLAALPDTKLTSKVRSFLRATNNRIVRLIFEEASRRGLDLATPSLINIASPSPFSAGENAGNNDSQA